ncbi:MAG: putative bifunctional diguanylate cyclase/phosphodiesterase [Solirubrobacteraceae bacterium]
MKAFWGQLLLVASGVIVTIAMVTISESARGNVDRHRQAQVLVAAIETSSQELNAIRAQAVADALEGGAHRAGLNARVVASALVVWRELIGSASALRALEPGSRSAMLERDSEALVALGLKALAAAKTGALSTVLRSDQVRFSQLLTRLDRDAAAVSQHELSIANQASTSAQTEIIASLVVGLLALALIGGRFHHVRRKIAVDEERREIETRSEARRTELENQLRHLAFHDSLTGLANRSLFENRLSHALAIADRSRQGFAVLFLDLDDFKTINDSLGHSHGDELLRAVGARLRSTLRSSDTAARLGGDEFGILIELVNDEQEAREVATRLREGLAVPFAIDGRDLRVTASMGLALWGGVGGVEDLLRNADMAMYAAKADGKAGIRAFEPSMHRRLVERLELTGELRTALDEQQFELDYQPIVELDSRRIVGVEALVRWRHPRRSRLAPGQFIGLAEETGLIVGLGDWVLQSACTQARAWQLAFPDQPLQLSVNVSTRQLNEPGFIERVGEVLAATELPPARLTLEITEGLLLGERDEVISQLDRLKALGLRVAVDDFGTGYSSLSHLRHLPIDILKIDKSFIDGIDRDPDKSRLVRGIVNLGGSLQLDVIAEGIEQQAQADEFANMNLRLAQGFLFFRPLSPIAIELLLAAADPRSQDALASPGALANS